MKFVDIPLTANHFPKPNLFWLDKPFKPVSEIFPQWMMAEPILEDYVDKLGDWDVSNTGCDVWVGPKQPKVWEHNLQERIPLWMSFPEEDRPLFLEIFERCVRDFTPDLQEMLGQKLTQSILYCLQSRIKSHHYYVEKLEGPQFKDWLKYNLGLYSRLNSFNFIHIETENNY